LHQARWRRRLLPGCFLGEAVRRFHREAAAGFRARGWLRLHALRIEGAVAAALYGFAARGRVCYYAGGFDPDRAKHGPGTLLLGHAIGAAVAGGGREWDFLRGDEAYKYRWGARNRPTRRLLLWHSSPAGRLAPALQSAERWIEAAIKRAARRWASG